MSIQDFILGAGQVAFIVALIPALRGRQKPPISTCVMTGGLLLVFSACYASLGLWWAMLSAAILGACWSWLALQQR